MRMAWRLYLKLHTLPPCLGVSMSLLSEDKLLTDTNKSTQTLQMSLYTSFGKSLSVNPGYCPLSYASRWEV
jgi:hypothetical protein